MTKARLAVAVAVAVLALPASALAVARISSDSNCPSTEAISLRLLGLLAAGGPEKASARVHADEQTMRIELSTPGEDNRERNVPSIGDCDARAETAALIIAAWLDAMPVGTISAPGIPPRDVGSAPRSRDEEDALDDPDEERLSVSTRSLVGAGLFGAADGQGATTGIAVEAATPNLLEQFGWTLRASLGLPRELAVGEGIAHYWRPTFVLAASADFSGKKWGLRTQVGPALGILLVNGTGYTKNRSDSAPTWGFDVGLVLLRRWDYREGWLRLGAAAWPQGRAIRSSAIVAGSDIVVALPGWEVSLCGGFSWAIL